MIFMIQFTDEIHMFRKSINDKFSRFFDSSNIDYDDMLYEIEKIKSNHCLYKNIVTIGYLDWYKIEFQHILYNDLNSSEIEEFMYLETNIHNSSDILIYVEDEDNIIEFLKAIIRFFNLDSNSQRELINDCKLKFNYLKTISPLHILDVLYYAYPYNLNDFLELCQEEKLENNTTICVESIVSFSHTLEEIFISDSKNYESIISELIETYKVMKYHHILGDDLVDKITDKDIVEIGNTCYTNRNLRDRLLDYYLQFSLLEDKEEFYKTYKKKYNKDK